MSPPAAKTSKEPMLEVRGLVKEYPGVKALDGVDFEVREGEVHACSARTGRASRP